MFYKFSAHMSKPEKVFYYIFYPWKKPPQIFSNNDINNHVICDYSSI